MPDQVSDTKCHMRKIDQNIAITVLLWSRLPKEHIHIAKALISVVTKFFTPSLVRPRRHLWTTPENSAISIWYFLGEKQFCKNALKNNEIFSLLLSSVKRVLVWKSFLGNFFLYLSTLQNILSPNRSTYCITLTNYNLTSTTYTVFPHL